LRLFSQSSENFHTEAGRSCQLLVFSVQPAQPHTLKALPFFVSEKVVTGVVEA